MDFPFFSYITVDDLMFLLFSKCELKTNILPFPEVQEKKKKILFRQHQFIQHIKKNLWLTGAKGATPVKKTSVTDWQMSARRDNVISIMFRQV